MKFAFLLRCSMIHSPKKMRAKNVHQSLQLAAQLHGQRRLKEAERLYKQVLSSDPKNPDALHLYGVLMHQTGRSGEGIKSIRRAIAFDRRATNYYENLANVYAEIEQPEMAVQCLRDALAIDPKAINPRIRLARFLNGELNRPREAVEELGQLFAIVPDYPDALLDMAVALHRSEEKTAALAYYEKALTKFPNNADVLCNYGTLLNELERYDDAVALLRRGTELDPRNFKLWYNLGLAHMTHEHIEEAIAAYRQTLQLKPDHGNAKFQLALLLCADNQLEESIELFSQTLDTKHDRALAYHNVAAARLSQGRLEPAISLLRKAITTDPDYEPGWQSLLMIRQYSFDDDPAALFAEHRAWAARHENIYPPRKHTTHRDPDRPLRVGYVSSDFRQHSVLFFLEPILAHHNRNRFEIFCYANQFHDDEATARLKSLGHQWRNISGLSDESAADLIEHDRIDILVDLSVHSSGNRLPVFARRPAPVQVSYLGYASTTGLNVMDYRLTDDWVDPPGMSESCNTEKLIRLPNTQWVYRTPTQIEISPLPAEANGDITFGLATNLAKVNEPTIELWSKVMNALPGSTLKIKAAALRDPNRPPAPGDFPILRYGGRRFWEDVVNSFADVFGRYGIDRQRVSFEPASQLGDYFRWFSQIDLTLDTFSFTGGTTTCHSLYMGVPVVTRTGRTAVSRVGSSVLHNVGLGELVADTPKRFIQISAELAQDLPRLAEIRRTLRDRMRQSPLMNEGLFVDNLESTYRAMWRKYCDSQR